MLNLLMDRSNTQTVISWFSPKADVFKIEASSQISKPSFTPQREIFRRASGLYYMASDLRCSGHKQMSTKCSSLLANYLAYPFPASPSNANTSWGLQRGWQYWGGQEKGIWCPIQWKKKKSQISEQETHHLHFSSTKQSSFPDLHTRVTGMIWKHSLGYYSLVLHLRFSVLSRTGGIQST